MDSAILVEGLGKCFYRYHAEKPVTIMEAALSGLRKIGPTDRFWALRDVSFEVAAGEMLGVVGHNGAGKSTLLQLLGKVTQPTEGRLEMRGRLGALLDLGAGFHGDLTGRENLFVAAIVAGLRRREVARRFDRIVEFAELTEFIDNPVRTYSSGMMMRLAFSIAVHTEPQILLVDEFLSVGDLSFQNKCLSHVAEMKARGCAIVLVSHNESQVEQLCDRALWLKNGTAMAYGEPTVVVGQYVTQMRSQDLQHPSLDPLAPTEPNGKQQACETRFGSQEIVITRVRLLPAASLQVGDSLCIEIDYQVNEPADSAIFGVTIRAEDGRTALDVNTLGMGIARVPLQARGAIRLKIDCIDLDAGKYFVDVGAYKQDWSYAYDYRWRAYPLVISSATVSAQSQRSPLQWRASAKMQWEIAAVPPQEVLPGQQK